VDSQSSTETPNVTLDLPSSLSPRVLNALKADPRTVELRQLAPHFYALGSRILELFEEDELVDVLSDVCESVGYPQNINVLLILKTELQEASQRDCRPCS